MTLRGRAAVAALVVAACGGSAKDAAPPAASSATSATAAPAGGATAATMDAKGCVHDGRWRPCGLVDRLEKAGLVVKPEKDSVRYDFLSVPGLRYTVGRGEVQAFFYDDTARMAHDVAGVDTVRVTKAGTFRHWDEHPTFVRSGNVVVILLTLSEALMDRVQFAVQAGPPQPEPPAAPNAAPTPPQSLPPARVP